MSECREDWKDIEFMSGHLVMCDIESLEDSSFRELSRVMNGNWHAFSIIDDDFKIKSIVVGTEELLSYLIARKAMKEKQEDSPRRMISLAQALGIDRDMEHDDEPRFKVFNKLTLDLDGGLFVLGDKPFFGKTPDNKSFFDYASAMSIDSSINKPMLNTNGSLLFSKLEGKKLIIAVFEDTENHYDICGMEMVVEE